MGDTERKLAVAFLKMASEEFSNHGCNDFDLTKLVPELEERQRILKEMYEWGKDASSYDPNYCDITYDWYLMSFIAHKLKQEI